jgi:hypothetical protein
MTLAMFTGLISGADVTAFITNMAIVFGGLVAVLLILSPAFLAKGGLEMVLSKVNGLFGGIGGR